MKLKYLGVMIIEDGDRKENMNHSLYKKIKIFWKVGKMHYMKKRWNDQYWMYLSVQDKRWDVWHDVSKEYMSHKKKMVKGEIWLFERGVVVSCVCNKRSGNNRRGNTC